MHLPYNPFGCRSSTCIHQGKRRTRTRKRLFTQADSNNVKRFYEILADPTSSRGQLGERGREKKRSSLVRDKWLAAFILGVMYGPRLCLYTRWSIGTCALYTERMASGLNKVARSALLLVLILDAGQKHRGKLQLCMALHRTESSSLCTKRGYSDIQVRWLKNGRSVASSWMMKLARAPWT